MNVTAEEIRALELIYSRLPKLECRGKCQAYCGVIAMSKPEWERIVARVGCEPKGDASLVCPLLDRATGRCTVYDLRPLICRVWGLVRDLACPHGCRPSRWLSDKEFRSLRAKVEAVARKTESGLRMSMATGESSTKGGD